MAGQCFFIAFQCFFYAFQFETDFLFDLANHGQTLSDLPSFLPADPDWRDWVDFENLYIVFN